MEVNTEQVTHYSYSAMHNNTKAAHIASGKILDQFNESKREWDETMESFELEAQRRENMTTEERYAEDFRKYIGW